MSQSTVTSTQQQCATCGKWCGNRDINLGRNLVLLEHDYDVYGKIQAKCAVKQIPMYASQSCGSYEKWSALK